MKYTDYNFLQDDSNFKYILDMSQVLNNLVYVSEVKNYNASVTNISDEFLVLALKAMNLSSVVFFLRDGKTFFEQFKLITTYDGFSGLLKSLFLSNDIVINTLKPCVIDIIVTNKNEALISNYIDVQKRLYKDTTKDYVGFKSDANSSLQSFFKMFLSRFLPAGIELNSITINSFTNLKTQRQKIFNQIINKRSK